MVLSRSGDGAGRQERRAGVNYLQAAHDLVGPVIIVMVLLLCLDAWEWQQQRAAAQERARLEAARQQRRLVDFVARTRTRAR